MRDDLRFAFRQLRKNPAFAATAVLTLALGVGAAAAMFGVINGVLLSPPPYARPAELHLVRPERIDGGPYTQRPTTSQWTGWRAESRTLDTQALYRWTFNFLVLPDGSESLGGMVVSPNYFRLVGLTPILGREFLDSEAAGQKSPPTAIIIGHDLWRRKFNGDPNVIGTSLRLSRMPAPLPIVGVMPAGARFLPDPGNASEPNYDVNAQVDFWLAAMPDETQLRARAWNVVSRLRSGATTAQANAELSRIAGTQAQANDELQGLTAAVHPLLDELNQDGRRLLMPLLASVGLVFFIACGNVAGLLLARGLQRHQEYAMRSVLGASRRRLFRQVLTESLTLAFLGAVAGSVLAAGLVRVLTAIGGSAIPRADAVSVGWPVFVAGAAAALVAAALAALLPAMRASAPERSQALEGTRTSTGRAERRLLAAVATFQIVLTVALLAGAALLVRTAQNLARVRPGYDTENILTMTVTSIQQDQWQSFHTQGLERVAALPGVTHTAFVWGLPLTGNKWGGDMEIVGEPGASTLAGRINFPMRAVSQDYFTAMSMRLVEGRAFAATDTADAPRVAIVNEALSRRYFPTTRAVGKRLRFAGNATQTIEIVGVMSDTRTETLSERAEPEVYFPLWQNRAFSKHLIVRATADPRGLAALVRRELHAIDPTAAVEHVRTMADIRRDSVAQRTFAMKLLTAFAVAATLLALVGLYGVLSLSVGARTKEIAVRQAIGAHPREIVRLVLREGLQLVGIGVAIGVVVAVLLGRALRALLFEVRPADPVTLTLSVAAFVAVALVACAVPAWRGARVDLMEALRHE